LAGLLLLVKGAETVGLVVSLVGAIEASARLGATGLPVAVLVWRGSSGTVANVDKLRSMTVGSLTTENRVLLLLRGLMLEYLTLGWNVVGVVVLVLAAVSARSVALAGFGLDSLIEIGASTVVVWQLTGTGAGRERIAMR
jgi:hypothetical protein